MISQLNSVAVANAYGSSVGDSKQTANTDKSATAEKTKVESLKESIDSGSYKVNLQAVAEKMAQDLL